MGGACSSGDDGDAYLSADRAGTLSPEASWALVCEKLRHSLFAGLMSQAQLAEFARHFTLRHYPPDAVLLKKGAPLDALFIVGEGQVRMEVDDVAGAAAVSPLQGNRSLSNGGSSSGGGGPGGGGNASGGGGASAGKRLLCVKDVGEFFGEGMLEEASAGGKGKSAATHELNAVASGECMLLVLSRRAYAEYLLKSPEMSGVLSSIAQSMEKQLQQLSFFQDVAPMQMKLLVSMFHFVPLMAESVLFRENDFDREAGNSLYFLYKGRVRVTNTEKKKQVAGQESFVSSSSNPAAFNSAFLGGSGDVTGAFIHPMGSSAPGAPVSVEEKVLNILEPGCFFGEVGLMMDIPRTATITAVESSLLLELSQNNFRHFLTIVPGILDKFNSVLLEYNIHLRWFLANPLVLSYFIQHCKAEFSTENIEFWMACRDFRKLAEDPSSTQEAIDARAKEIKSKFIGAAAESQVNLKGSVEAKLIRGLARPPVTEEVFADAEEEILGLMASDSFGRFKASDLFKSCIETVNSPYTAILRKLFLI